MLKILSMYRIQTVFGEILLKTMQVFKDFEVSKIKK